MSEVLLSWIPLTRSAESRTWARGQLKYDGIVVLWSLKLTEKMLLFGLKNDVIPPPPKKKLKKGLL